jgi:quinol-cytochrome oxidoreductase complex cytochrome b subunit
LLWDLLPQGKFISCEGKKFFTSVVHLFMKLNTGIMNPVSEKTPVKMYVGAKMPVYFLEYFIPHFFFVVVIAMPFYVAVFFGCSLCGN